MLIFKFCSMSNIRTVIKRRLLLPGQEVFPLKLQAKGKSQRVDKFCLTKRKKFCLTKLVFAGPKPLVRQNFAHHLDTP